MRSFVSGWLVAMGALAVVASRAEATAGRRDDMCTQPKMKTEKWKSQDEVGGMQVLIPPGFTKGGHSYYLETADSHFYQSGEHRSITIGSGRGPEFLRRNGAVSEEAECETVIAGRRVNITKYRWTVEDATLSASGNAGSRFVAVERFYALGNLREVFVALESNSPSDFSYYRGLFWTVTFPGNAIAECISRHSRAARRRCASSNGGRRRRIALPRTMRSHAFTPNHRRPPRQLRRSDASRQRGADSARLRGHRAAVRQYRRSLGHVDREE